MWCHSIYVRTETICWSVIGLAASHYCGSLVSNTFWKRDFYFTPFLRYSFRCVAQAGHKPGSLLPLWSECWGYRYVPLRPARRRFTVSLHVILLLRNDVLSFVAFLQSSAVVLLGGVGIPRS